MRRFILLLLFAGSVQAEAVLDAGPENQGLQLRFKITDEGVGAHTFTLEILNRRKQAVELRANGVNPGSNYSDHLKNAAHYVPFPLVHSFAPQITVPVVVTKMMLRNGEASKISDLKDEDGNISAESTTVKIEIAAGDSLKAEWQVAGIPGYARRREVFYPFPPGLYGLRAQLLVETANDTVLLYSNEHPFVLGGSRTAPKPPIARARWMDEKTRIAQLDIGQAERVEVGDRYGVPHPMGGTSWTLTVTKLNEQGAEAKVEPSSNAWKPEWPKAGTLLVWMPHGS